VADHRTVVGHGVFFDSADKAGVQFLDGSRRREAAFPAARSTRRPAPSASLSTANLLTRDDAAPNRSRDGLDQH
jgi:hypothetical protein